MHCVTISLGLDLNLVAIFLTKQDHPELLKKTHPKQRHKLQTLLLLTYTAGVYTETSWIKNEIPFFHLSLGLLSCGVYKDWRNSWNLKSGDRRNL